MITDSEDERVYESWVGVYPSLRSKTSLNTANFMDSVSPRKSTNPTTGAIPSSSARLEHRRLIKDELGDKEFSSATVLGHYLAIPPSSRDDHLESFATECRDRLHCVEAIRQSLAALRDIDESARKATKLEAEAYEAREQNMYPHLVRRVLL